MKSPSRDVLISIALVLIIIGGFLVFCEMATPGAKAEDGSTAAVPVASVQVAPVRTKTVSSAVTVFGDVIPAPGAVWISSMLYEIRVDRIFVSAGQKVSKGEPLIEVEPSPGTLLQLAKAGNSLEISKKSLAHVKQLFDLKLATNNQMLAAEEAFQKASLELDNLKRMGVDGKQTISAKESGLISSVTVQEGEIVADGKPLVGVVSENRLEVRLGVEPNDSLRLVSGQAVTLSYVNEPSKRKVTGKIRKIARAVNKTTRLVDVFVSLPASCGFLLGEYIRGDLQIASSYGMVVPRSAVLPEGGGYILYTVRNGHAVKHMVQVGIETGSRVQVFGGGVRPGDEAVILGNYELSGGMAVKVVKTR